MKKKMFEALLGSVREEGVILRGQKRPSRRIVIGSSALGPFANEPAFRNRSLPI